MIVALSTIIWRPPAGAQPITELQLTGHTCKVATVATAQLDGHPVIIAGGGDRTVRVWDRASGAPNGSPITGHTEGVEAVATAQMPNSGRRAGGVVPSARRAFGEPIRIHLGCASIKVDTRIATAPARGGDLSVRRLGSD